MDNVAVGPTRDDGFLLLEREFRVAIIIFGSATTALMIGRLMLSATKPQRVIAQLRARGASAPSGVPYPGGVSLPKINTSPPAPTRGFANTGSHDEPDKTIIQSWGGQTGNQSIFTQSQPPKRSFFSPVVITGLAVVVLFLLGAAGLGGAYMLGLFGRPATSDKPPGQRHCCSFTIARFISVSTVKPDMVSIPGGTFMMGRNDGSRPLEKPEHQVTVNSFLIDRNEITNREYLAFVTETGYQPLPAHWVNGKPISGQEKMPVRF